MKLSRGIFCTFLFVLISLQETPTCLAFQIGNHLSLNGYLSQGYIESSGNNFFGDSLDGSFEINEFALTTNYIANNQLRLGLQLLSRDLGEEGNNEILIDWAVADYHWQDWLGLRLGKVKLPIGLYNQGRDTDFLRPMVFLPQSIYDENKRSLLVAATGGSIYGNFFLGNGGYLDYQAYYGKVDFREDSGQAQGIRYLVSNISRMKNLGSVSDFDSENRYVCGGSLLYSPPLDALRFGVSYFTGKTDFDFRVGGRKGEASGTNKDFIVLSVEYAQPDWKIAFEYSEFTGDRKALGIDIPDGRSQGAYVQLCYHLYDELVLSALYDIFYADKNDHSGSKYADQGQPDYLGWRKDFGLGIRWNITNQLIFKAEHHWVDGASLQLPIFNPQGVEEHWNYFVLKTSFNF
ncbi:MAG: hypothetical protein KQH63_05235 [Desulfobulbaceae bacterium]|nr:hypothetical protein [Desulfobulbaceae bacterium]